MRRLLILCAALLLMGAAKPDTVDYRLSLEGSGASVEMRLRGDGDGQTTLTLPAILSGLTVKGAKVSGPGVLQHRPRARITVRYRTGPFVAVMPGEAVFATPQGRNGETATFAWGRAPAGWRLASDLEGRALTVADVGASVVAAGTDLTVAEGPDGLRVAATAGGHEIARAVAAQRTYWGVRTPELVVVAVSPDNAPPLARGAGILVRIAPASTEETARLAAADYARVILGSRIGATAPDWLSGGFAEVVADRVRLAAGLDTPDSVAIRLNAGLRGHDAAPTAAGRPGAGTLLALKWDEAVRQATGGKADLDDVLAQMASHYRRFPPGQGPDAMTGLISAAWVIAKLDIRPDIARYATGGTAVDLPEEMFDGCLQARVTVSPGFDAGFDVPGSFAARVVRGVRTRGPAWSSGLRNGMRLDAWTFVPGDMARQIELTVRPATGKGRPRKITYWPYGDVDVRTRRIQLTPGMNAARTTACGRKIGGL